MAAVQVRESELEANQTTAVIKEEITISWKSYIWDSLGKSPEERRFLFKLDAALLTIASLGYFIRYLDQANLNNAFVSGLKEDLSLYGNQLNYMQTTWTIGYVLGELPSNIILTRVRASYWIPALEITWSVLTMLTTRCRTAQHLYVIHFFIGLAESGFYPGMQYIIGSWYRKDELAKRSCIFHLSGAIAIMFSGYLMAATYKLDGQGGLAGWQWLFIMDGVISLPVAFAGFYLLPDVPEITRARYLTKEDVVFAQKRMELEGRAKRQPYTRTSIKKILTSWHIYAFTLLYILYNNGNAYAAPVFAQYLKHSKSPKYTVSQINTYPTGTYAIQVVSTLAYAWTSDIFLKGKRWPPIIFASVLGVILYASLAAWDIPEGWRWACYYLQGFSGGMSGMTYTWAHEVCTASSEERAIVMGTMNEMAYVFQAWLPLLVWQQIEAPEYKKGFATATVLVAGMGVQALVIKWLVERDEKKALEETASTGEVQKVDSAEESVEVEGKELKV